MKEKVIAIFDVGKTNKKLLLFDYNLKLVLEQEIRVAERLDDDGFECDDIELVEKWILESIQKLVHSDKYDLTALNLPPTVLQSSILTKAANGLARHITTSSRLMRKFRNDCTGDTEDRMNSAEELPRLPWECSIQAFRFSGLKPPNRKFLPK